MSKLLGKVTIINLCVSASMYVCVYAFVYVCVHDSSRRSLIWMEL